MSRGVTAAVFVSLLFGVAVSSASKSEECLQKTGADPDKVRQLKIRIAAADSHWTAPDQTTLDNSTVCYYSCTLNYGQGSESTEDVEKGLPPEAVKQKTEMLRCIDRAKQFYPDDICNEVYNRTMCFHTSPILHPLQPGQQE